jgi:hypothetical protein
MAARFTSLINAGFGLPQLSPVAFDLTGENKLPFVYASQFRALEDRRQRKTKSGSV